MRLGNISSVHARCLAVLALAVAGFRDTKLQDVLSEHITVKLVKEHVEYLASDELEGRNTGYEGAEKAAKYLVERFGEYGIKQIPGWKSYLQEFSYVPRTGMGSMGRLKKEGDDTKKTCNIVAYFEGTDGKLKDTVVVVGAHYDHCGRNGQADNPGRMGKPTEKDDIWNGANDNASGTSALLAMAKALGSGQIKTKRSIVLVAFSGEEHGLLGSKYYVENPPVPLEKTIAMINIDSIGRMKDNKLHIYNITTSPEWSDIAKKNAEPFKLEIALEKSRWPQGMDSDHTSFSKKGIPSIGLRTGTQKERHTIHDEASTIDYDGLAAIARYVLTTAIELANREKPLSKKSGE